MLHLDALGREETGACDGNQNPSPSLSGSPETTCWHLMNMGSHTLTPKVHGAPLDFPTITLGPSGLGSRTESTLAEREGSEREEDKEEHPLMSSGAGHCCRWPAALGLNATHSGTFSSGKASLPAPSTG